MTMQRLYTDEQFAQAIPGSGGIIATIADRVGCSWHTASKTIRANAQLLDMYQHEENKIADLAESIVIRAIRNGDVATAKWYLERRRRGTYATRTEVSADVVASLSIGLRTVDYRADLSVIAPDVAMLEEVADTPSSHGRETIGRYLLVDGSDGRKTFAEEGETIDMHQHGDGIGCEDVAMTAQHSDDSAE